MANLLIKDPDMLELYDAFGFQLVDEEDSPKLNLAGC